MFGIRKITVSYTHLRIDQRTDFNGKQFCSIFKILPFDSGSESNHAENKMHKLLQDYTHTAPYYA